MKVLQLEARAVEVARSQAVLATHGVNWRPGTTFACDYDGSFAPKWVERKTMETLIHFQVCGLCADLVSHP